MGTNGLNYRKVGDKTSTEFAEWDEREKGRPPWKLRLPPFDFHTESNFLFLYNDTYPDIQFQRWCRSPIHSLTPSSASSYMHAQVCVWGGRVLYHSPCERRKSAVEKVQVCVPNSTTLLSKLLCNREWTPQHFPSLDPFHSHNSIYNADWLYCVVVQFRPKRDQIDSLPLHKLVEEEEVE